MRTPTKVALEACIEHDPTDPVLMVKAGMVEALRWALSEAQYCGGTYVIDADELRFKLRELEDDDAQRA